MSFLLFNGPAMQWRMSVPALTRIAWSSIHGLACTHPPIGVSRRPACRKEMNCIAVGRMGMYLPPEGASCRVFGSDEALERLRQVRARWGAGAGWEGEGAPRHPSHPRAAAGLWNAGLLRRRIADRASSSGGGATCFVHNSHTHPPSHLCHLRMQALRAPRLELSEFPLELRSYPTGAWMPWHK